MNVMLKCMKCKGLFCAIAGLVLACVPAAAQEKGYWRAANSPAETITGDVAFADGRLSISFSNFPIARIRDLAPGEVSAVFDLDSTDGRGGLYRLNIPAAKIFMHHNTLCGSEDTQWMATYASGNSLHVAFFSGPKMPVLTLDAMANSTDVCGIFAYAR